MSGSLPVKQRRALGNAFNFLVPPHMRFPFEAETVAASMPVQAK